MGLKKQSKKCEEILVVAGDSSPASGPGFESPTTTKIFSFSFAFFQTPLREKVSNLFFYEWSEFDNYYN